MEGDVVCTPDKILAVVPPPASAKISNARFNYMTPERNSRPFSVRRGVGRLAARQSPRSIWMPHSRMRVQAIPMSIMFSPLQLETLTTFIWEWDARNGWSAIQAISRVSSFQWKNRVRLSSFKKFRQTSLSSANLCSPPGRRFEYGAKAWTAVRY